MSVTSRQLRAQEHFFPQIWLLTISVIAFAGYVAIDLSYAQMMFAADRSRLSLLITLVFLVASCHAAWNIFATSARLRAATALLRGEAAEDNGQDGPAADFIGDFLNDLRAEARSPDGHDGRGAADGDSILEIYADQLRSPVDIGWFVVDMQIRLGLVGTIIGFILMLASLAEGPMPDSDDIRALLISMSGGMGTALYTTLAGLIAASLLGIQYMILGRSAERLVAALIRIERRSRQRQAAS